MYMAQRNRRNRKRREPVKRSPLFQEDTMLSFDDPHDQEELATLTVQQKMDKFMSKFMILVDPFVTYADFFEHAVKTSSHVLLDIKRNYKTVVLEDGWTERKYVAVVDSLLRGGADVNAYTLQSYGFMYDRDTLPSTQRTQRRSTTRRVRKPGK